MAQTIAGTPLPGQAPGQPSGQTPAQLAAQRMQQEQIAIAQQQQQAIQAENAPEPQQTVHVITYSERGGYGSGTYRNVYLDGKPYETIQIPKSYEGRDEEYIRSQYPEYKTLSQVTSAQFEQAVQRATAAKEAEHQKAIEREEEQKFLKGSFMGREAQARVYGLQKPEKIIGIEAAKEAEALSAKERQISPTIAAILRSPSATIAEESAQKAYDIVQRGIGGLAPEEIKATIPYTNVYGTQTIGQPSPASFFGEPVYRAPPTAFDIAKAQLEEKAKEYYIPKPEYITREYISPKAPLSFRIGEGIKDISANIQSFDVMFANVNRFFKPSPETRSQYIESKEAVFKRAAKIKEAGYPWKETGMFFAESPILQSMLIGYGAGLGFGLAGRAAPLLTKPLPIISKIPAVGKVINPMNILAGATVALPIAKQVQEGKYVEAGLNIGLMGISLPYAMAGYRAGMQFQVSPGMKAFLKSEEAVLQYRPREYKTPTKEQIQKALEKGAAPISERGVMSLQFGSRGYKPTGGEVIKPKSGLLMEYEGILPTIPKSMISKRITSMIDYPKAPMKFDELGRPIIGYDPKTSIIYQRENRPIEPLAMLKEKPIQYDYTKVLRTKERPSVLKGLEELATRKPPATPRTIIPPFILLQSQKEQAFYRGIPTPWRKSQINISLIPGKIFKVTPTPGRTPGIRSRQKTYQSSEIIPSTRLNLIPDLQLATETKLLLEPATRTKTETRIKHEPPPKVPKIVYPDFPGMDILGITKKKKGLKTRKTVTITPYATIEDLFNIRGVVQPTARPTGIDILNIRRKKKKRGK